MADASEPDRLRREVTGLFQYLNRVRAEIAQINQPGADSSHFTSMAEQLDAIVAATEKATNTIMEVMELNSNLLGQLRGKLQDPEQTAIVDKVLASQGDIFEACSFQDITGQRVSKIVKSIAFVEERVNALIEIWGREQLASVEVTDASDKLTEDEKLLHGPQLEGAGLSQADIDALFD